MYEQRNLFVANLASEAWTKIELYIVATNSIPPFPANSRYVLFDYCNYLPKSTIESVFDPSFPRILINNTSINEWMSIHFSASSFTSTITGHI